MTGRERGRRPRLLLLGHFGGLNVGDDLMAAGFVRGYENRADMLLVVKDATRVPAPISNRVSLVPAKPWPVLRAALGSDAVVLVGGSHFQDDLPLRRYPRHVRYLVRYLLVFALMRLRGKEVFLVGQGLGPLHRPLSRLLGHAAVALASAVTVRDHASKSTARAVAHLDPPIGFDLAALALDSRRQATRASGSDHALRIGVSLLPFETVETTRGVRDELLGSLATALASFAPGHRVEITLFSLRGGEREADLPILTELGTALSEHAIAVRHVVYDGDLERFLSEYSAMDVQVCCRYHAAALAYLLGIPFMAIAYHEKVRALFDYVGRSPELCLRPRELAQRGLPDLRRLLDAGNGLAVEDAKAGARVHLRPLDQWGKRSE